MPKEDLLGDPAAEQIGMTTVAAPQGLGAGSPLLVGLTDGNIRILSL
jgi:hypothetical protein